MKKKNFLILLCIFILAAFLRLFQLSVNPPSLDWDEAAWGYNAYSLGIDGRDEFGRFLPHDYLESFGDFKPPVYAYLDIIPVKVLGLNEFATRLPSAVFGVLTVLITYFLVKSIFGQESEFLALLSTFFLAVSPWHINLSRAAFESNVSTFFIIAGVWLFLESMRKRRWLLILSIASFTISLYIFNTARIVSPLLLIALCIGFKDELLKRKKILATTIVVGLLLILPTLRFLFTSQAQLRFQEVNIFSDPSVVKTANQEIKNDNNASWSKIVHNRRLEYGFSFIKHYFDNLNPDFLFIKGDGNPKFSTQDVGQMYLWDLPFIVAGALILFKKRRNYWWILPVWLILGIIPAATARETPHALRIETTLPTFQIITAIGVAWSLDFFKGRKYKNIFVVVIFGLLFLNFLYYYHGYYAHYARIYSGEWQYGYKDSVAYVMSNQQKYDRVNITDQLGRPYIYYLFYGKINPSWFRSNSDVSRDAFGFVTVNRVGKYYFGKDPNAMKATGKTLFINTPNNVPGNATIVQTFYLLNGSPILKAYTL